MARRTVLTSRQRSALFALPEREADLLRHYTLSDEDLQPVQMPFEARDRRQVHRGPRVPVQSRREDRQPARAGRRRALRDGDAGRHVGVDPGRVPATGAVSIDGPEFAARSEQHDEELDRNAPARRHYRRVSPRVGCIPFSESYRPV